MSCFVSHLRQKTRRCAGLRARRSTKFPGLRQDPAAFRVVFRVAPATENAPLRGAPGQTEDSIPGAPPRPCRVSCRVSCRTCDKKRAVAWGAGHAEHSIPRAPPSTCRVSCRTCDKKRAVALGSGPGGALHSQGSTGSVSRFVSHLRQRTCRCVGRRARRSTRFRGPRRVRVAFRVAPATAHQNSPKSGVLRIS